MSKSANNTELEWSDFRLGRVLSLYLGLGIPTWFATLYYEKSLEELTGIDELTLLALVALLLCVGILGFFLALRRSRRARAFWLQPHVEEEALIRGLRTPIVIWVTISAMSVANLGVAVHLSSTKNSMLEAIEAAELNP